MNKYPLISVTCAVKNDVKRIKKAIDSVLMQDYPNIEVIVQDGASTDGTLELLKEYGNRIQLFSESDKDVEEGINRAFKRVKGDYYFNINSDEYLLSDSLFSNAVSLFNNNPQLGAVHGNLFIIDDNGDYLHTFYSENFTTEDVYLNNVSIIFSSFLWDLNKIRKLGYNYINKTIEFDLGFLISAFYETKYINVPFVAYRIGLNTSSARGEILSDFEKAYNRVENIDGLFPKIIDLFKYKDSIIDLQKASIYLTGHKFYQAVDLLYKVVNSEYFKILKKRRFLNYYQTLISLSICAKEPIEAFKMIEYLKNKDLIFQGYYWAVAITYNKLNDFDKVFQNCKKEIELNPNYDRAKRLLEHIEIRKILLEKKMNSIDLKIVIEGNWNLEDNMLILPYRLIFKKSDFEVVFRDSKINNIYIESLIFDKMSIEQNKTYFKILNNLSVNKVEKI